MVLLSCWSSECGTGGFWGIGNCLQEQLCLTELLRLWGKQTAKELSLNEDLSVFSSLN